MAISKRIKDNIVKVFSGEMPPKPVEMRKVFYVSSEVRLGDVVGTEYGIYLIDRQLNERKFKGRLTDATKDAYFIVRDDRQNALTFANAKKESL